MCAEVSLFYPGIFGQCRLSPLIQADALKGAVPIYLCGGSVAGEFVWMVDGVDYATTWVEVRAMWGRGQANTLAAPQETHDQEEERFGLRSS